MAVVVDTDVASYLFKKDTRIRAYRPLLRGQDLVLAFMSLAELQAWSIRNRWGQTRQQALDRFIQGFTVSYANAPLCRLWGEVTDRAVRNGHPIDGADAWIAATALYLDLPLVTNNAKDYSAVVGLTIFTQNQ